MIHKKCLTSALLAFTLCCSFSQCKTIKKDDPEIMKPILPITSFNKKEDSKLNEDNTMKLEIVRSMKPNDQAIHFSYKVYNIKTNDLVKEGKYRGVGIEWNDVTSLKLTPYIGNEFVPDPKKNSDSSAKKDKNYTQITIINLNN